jgi:hypothetical protein
MKRKSLTPLLLVFTATLYSCTSQQKPDRDYDVTVISPVFINSHPKVLFDEAHNNFHKSNKTYRPFVSLIRNDGFEVKPNKKQFTADLLGSFDILIISNARGKKQKEDSAFTDAECSAVANWVNSGGALLLIADHYPFGGVVESLSQKFGVHMYNGETADSIFFEGNEQFRDKLVFSRENGLLGDNPVCNGSNQSESLNRVVSDRGQSLSIPDNAMVLLRLSDKSYHALPDSVWHEGNKTFTRFADPVSAAGNCQGLALKHGNGRVVILGEAAMITAQVYEGEKFGMNTPGNDNRQFALNIMHWLAKKLDP